MPNRFYLKKCKSNFYNTHYLICICDISILIHQTALFNSIASLQECDATKASYVI